jgi:hypothetical protein
MTSPTVDVLDPATWRRPGWPGQLLRWDDWAALVTSPHQAFVAHLAAQFHTVEAAARAVEQVPVTAVVDPARTRAVADLAPAGGERREAFAASFYRVVEHESGMRIWVAEAGHDGRHAMLRSPAGDWLLVADTLPELRQLGVRTLRELVRERCVAAGALMFHASAAAPDGAGAVLFAGMEGVGKTTLAVQVARSGGRCVASDRTMVAGCCCCLRAIGLPTTTRLGREAAAAWHVARALIGRAGSGKVALSNQEALNELGCGYVAALPLRAVCVVSLAAPGAPAVAGAAGPADVALLERTLLRPDDAYRSFWLADGAREPACASNEAVAALVSAVPTLSLVWDPRAHDSGVVASRLCAALPAPAGEV